MLFDVVLMVAITMEKFCQDRPSEKQCTRYVKFIKRDSLSPKKQTENIFLYFANDEVFQKSINVMRPYLSR